MFSIIDLILYKKTILEISVYNALCVILGFICKILYIYQIKLIDQSINTTPSYTGIHGNQNRRCCSQDGPNRCKVVNITPLPPALSTAKCLISWVCHST